MALMKMPCAVGTGGGVVITEATDTMPFTISGNHRYMYISLYRSSTPSLTYKGSTVTPLNTESGYLYTYLIENVKDGETISGNFGSMYASYID